MYPSTKRINRYSTITFHFSVILYCLMICLLFTTPLKAQDFPRDFTVAVGAGFSFPIDPLASRTKTGFNFTASGGPRFNPRLSLTLDFSLHYMNAQNALHSVLNNIPVSFGSEVRVWSLTVNPNYEFIRQERFSSYATGGYGLYNRKLLLAAPGLIPGVACDDFFDACISNSTQSIVVNGDLNPYKGGYNVGGGVNFGSHVKFFAEARYHHMFTNRPTEIIPLTFGIRW
jgi:opacity protein-like surface antigen